MVRRFAALGMVAVLALGACGGDDSGGGSASETTRGSSTEASAKTASTTDAGDADAGSDGRGTEAIESAENCEQLVEAATPVFTRLFQGLVDDVQGLSVADLAKLENAEESELFKKWTDQVEAETKAIDDKVNDLDCSEEDGKKAVCDAVAAIEADNVIAEEMVKGMAGEC